MLFPYWADSHLALFGNFLALCLSRRDESVSSFGKRLNVARLLGRIVERCSEPPDGRIDAVIKFDYRSVRPQPGDQLLARHDLAGALQQHCQDLEGLIRQRKLVIVLAQFAGGQVERIVPKPNDANAALSRHARPALA